MLDNPMFLRFKNYIYNSNVNVDIFDLRLILYAPIVRWCTNFL